MNVYDFDKTICKDDTENDFFKYQLKRKPINWLRIPYFIRANHLYKKGIIDEPEWRHRIYLVLKNIKDIDTEVKTFWKKRKKKILPWYLNQQKENDVIISATPRFLLEPILKELNITHYIVSEFDLKERKFIGPINVEMQKLTNFKKVYNINEIDSFYTDSLRDLPLLKVAKHPYLITKKYQIIEFKN